MNFILSNKVILRVPQLNFYADLFLASLIVVDSRTFGSVENFHEPKIKLFKYLANAIFANFILLLRLG